MDKIIALIKENWNSLKLYFLIAIVAIGLAIAVGMTEKNEDKVVSQAIEKSEPGEKKIKESYLLEIEGLVSEYPFEVEIDNRKLTFEEQKKYFGKAIAELEKEILGENKGLDYIDKPLNLVKELQNGLIKVSYSWGNHRAINYAGEPVENNLKKEGILVEITATLKYRDVKIEHVIPVRVYPVAKTQEEEVIELIGEVIEGQNESESNIVMLPQKIGDSAIKWDKPKELNKSMIVLIIGLVAMVAVALGKRNDARKAKRERENTLKEQYSGVLNQLSLLLSAGMTVMNAWERVVQNYRKKQLKDKRIAYEEMETTYNQIKDGMSERQAYEQFGERVGVSEYRKLASLLAQNLRKGTAGLSRILEEESIDAYSRQESIVKKKGEEMSTKLLLPMMLMLGLVIVIIVIPAIFNFGG